MKRIFIGFAVLLTLGFFIFADEGMWMLSQLKDLGLDNKGLEIDLPAIYSPDKPCIANSVVQLGGGTAELVSANGLILTNHHVAYRAVQRASTKGTDFISLGFLARSLDEEIEASGYSARILQRMEDITPQFAKFAKIKDPVKRTRAIDLKIKKIRDKIEKGKTDIEADVAKMFNGKQYWLCVYKRFDDVRVVYVPPAAVGNYGDEIDNWMWPRHTGDFSFMRIYMAPDGSGRKYHKDNVPYKPKYWLKPAQKGLNEGDLTFIMGYPGSTTRYRTSYSVRENLEYNYPARIKAFGDVIQLLEKFGKDSQVALAKVSGLNQGLQNVIKNYRGNVDCMKRTRFLEKKIQFENRLMDFLKKDEKLFKTHGDILDKIKEQYDILAKYREQDDAITVMPWLGGTLARIAMEAYFMVREREKPKSLRDPGFSEKDNQRRISRLHFSYMSYYEPADKGLLVYMLNMFDQMPENQRIKGLDYIVKNPSKSIVQWVDEAYKATKLNDVEFAKTLFNKTSKELHALNDPLINMARSIYDEYEAHEKRTEAFNAAIAGLRKQYIDALYAWKGKGLYPDANGTMRFSHGWVKGYAPRDAVYYKPFTTLTGVLEKDTGVEPFDVPEKLKDLYKEKDFGQWPHSGLKDIPVAFVHTVDSTGGSSGSPVLNAKGELAGILFDGNYEAITSDWQYEADIQRSISVDIRYVLFITEKLAGAHHLLKEMGVR
jgi:UDP-2,3-diacylglucosamine pyrophosphatase LpxH